VKDKNIGVLGLAFKPDTDDMRDAPSVSIINKLSISGAKIKAYDPVAMENAKKIIAGIEYGKDPYDVCEKADLLIVVTEWNEFKQLDLEKIKKLMKTPVILDARNIYESKEVIKLGFIYQGIGR
jgi:UDPglucose 6-dehydrogenase